MPINAAAVGSETAAYDHAITTRQCLAYAAALGETSAVHFDDARLGGIVAVPAMVVALEWPPSRDLRLIEEFGVTPEEHLRVVHAEQDTQYHALIRPGDELRAKGRLVGVEAIKPGAKTLTKLTLETAEGAPVATSYSTAIYRGVAVDGTDAVEETAPAWPETPAPEGWAETPVPVARQFPHIYTECADIFSAIHTERTVALAAGLPDIIAHGTSTWALAAKVITAAHLDGDPGRLARFTGRFTGMVIPGTTITVRHAAIAGGVRYEVLAADGAKAISLGRAMFKD